MTRKQENLVRIPVILLGNVLIAFAVAAFVLPNGLISGGVTGIGLVLHHFFKIEVSIWIAIFNILFFILGAVSLGKRFALTTLLSTVFFPIVLGVFQRLTVLQNLTGDPLLASIYAGGLTGLGVGVVLKVGASTGGLDIPPLVLHKKTGLPVSAFLYGFDVIILLGQTFFSKSEQVLYGIVMVCISSFLVNKVLTMGESRSQVQIISEKSMEINEAIHTAIDRGSTLVLCETGYLHQKSYMVQTVISHRELPKLDKLVMEIDPHAFLVVSAVNQVRGRGFTIDKREVL